MRDAEWSRSTLLAYFAQFFEEVAQYKAAIAEGRLARLLEGDLPADPRPDDLAEAISRRLLHCLEQQQRLVAARADEAEQMAYREMLYAMAALADEEFLLALDWPGSEAWLRHLLEQALFHTSQAGQRFFARADQLLRGHAPQGAQRELAAVYLLVLQLGFQGQYRGRSGQPVLADFRARLIACIAAQRPADAAAAPAFAQAYAYTLGQHADLRLAPLRPWLRAAAAALVAYLLLSAALWFGLLHPAAQRLHAMIAGA